MSKKVSLKDIANHVGVSTALVSYVINGQQKEKRVGKKMAGKIMKAAEELNYNPNHIARSLRKGATKTIGLVVADIANPFFGTMARVMEDEANKNGYTVIFGSSDEDPDKSGAVINSLMNRQVDGFIIVPVENTEKQIDSLVKKGIPFVLVDRYLKGIETNYVVLDNYNASFKAVNLLVQKNYRRIGVLGFFSEMTHMEERFNGYRDAMVQAGLSDFVEIGKVRYNEMKEDIKDALDRYTFGERRLEAILFATNSLTIEGLYYFKKNKVRIPEDLAVIGFDGSVAFDFFYSPLTYIEQPVDLMGKKSVEQLLRQIDKLNATFAQVKLSHLLIERSSSG